MAETKPRSVLITGVSRFLGLRLAKRLENDPRIGSLVGVDLEEPPIRIEGLEFVRADIRNPMIARVLEATKVDTLVHTNIASSPSVLGGRSQMKENNVIGTMQLLAAAQRAEKIKKVIVKSSTAVYGSRPGEPSVIPEDYASREADLGGYGKDCAEAEQYARDYGRRRPDVELTILRTQNVVGPTVRTNITDYLSLPVVPTALGYDPRLQFLHEVDATEALYQTVMQDTRGIFNIAGDGVVFLSQAVRLMDRPALPLLLPAAQTAAGLLRRFGLVDFPTDQLKLILFGRVVNTQRAKAAFGFSPNFSTLDTLKDFRDHRIHDQVPEPSAHPTWERELFEYLKQRATNDREKV
ncbi:MAG TPA: NAD-dependent epimerase/dehydratase family protein [Actinomycetota bacterium]|nr:NAD-dependent epimerase/dehydratase family protein [Actinomycetota bacterium]